jgi:hypothetical protein
VGHADDGDDVEGSVRLAMTVPVETVADRFTAGGGNGRDAAEGGEGRFTSKTVRIIASGNEQGSGDVGTYAGEGEKLRSGLGDEEGDVGVQIGDLLAEGLVTPRQRAKGELGGGEHVGGDSTWTEARGPGDELRDREAGEGGAQLIGGRDEEGAKLVYDLTACLDGGAPSSCENADHLGVAVRGLGENGTAAGEDRAGGELRVDGIGLTAAAKVAALGPFDLEDVHALRSEEAGEAGAVGAGALNAGDENLAERGGPEEELAVARRRGRKGFGAEEDTQWIDKSSGVGVEVGIDTNNDGRARPWLLHDPPHLDVLPVSRTLAEDGTAKGHGRAETGSYEVTNAKGGTGGTPARPTDQAQGTRWGLNNLGSGHAEGRREEYGI